MVLILLLHVSARLGHNQVEHLQYEVEITCYIKNYLINSADLLQSIRVIVVHCPSLYEMSECSQFLKSYSMLEIGLSNTVLSLLIVKLRSN